MNHLPRELALDLDAQGMLEDDQCFDHLCPGPGGTEVGTCPATKVGFACTRRAGHKGPHIACGGRSHNFKVWRDNEDSECVNGNLCKIGRRAGCDATNGDAKCTRAKGHEGPHIACGIENHNLTKWTEEERQS